MVLFSHSDYFNYILRMHPAVVASYDSIHMVSVSPSIFSGLPSKNLSSDKSCFAFIVKVFVLLHMVFVGLHLLHFCVPMVPSTIPLRQG